MPEIFVILLLHQTLFQGMFVLKNTLLRRKIGQKIRGNNIEATVSIVFFALFIGVALGMSLVDLPFGRIQLAPDPLAWTIGLFILMANLLISAASLHGLKGSWRVGVLAEQKTELVTSGIYRFSRNPYFASYLLMFVGYTLLLQNGVLLILSGIGFLLVHSMVRKEESYLTSVHGEAYLLYKGKTARYLVV